MSSRLEFVLLAQQPGANISALCRQFEISPKTAYKWIKRFGEQGKDGLQDRSRKPHRSPASTPAELEAEVLSLHDRYPYWGGRKLRELLPERGARRPHHSTIDSILSRNGREVVGAPTVQNKPPIRFEHSASNLLWQMDFKGHFGLTDPRAGRCHPLTVLDDYSRYSVCLVACGNQQYPTVKSALESTFRRYGLPERITADNGPPWGSASAVLTQLEVWLIRLGIRISHSRPYHPQTQGKDERFHRTLKLELLDRRGFYSIADCQKAFDEWRNQYNTVRPHQALNWDKPANRYQPSGREYPESLPSLEYDSGEIVRKVDRHGYIAYKTTRHFIGEGLRSQPVVVRPTEIDSIFNVYFCHHHVREISLTDVV